MTIFTLQTAVLSIPATVSKPRGAAFPIIRIDTINLSLDNHLGNLALFDGLRNMSILDIGVLFFSIPINDLVVFGHSLHNLKISYQFPYQSVLL